MRYLFFTFMVIATLCIPLSPIQSFGQEDAEKVGIYDVMLSATCRLEYVEKTFLEGSNEKGQPLIETRIVPWGTGFFVAVGNETYILTARHVAEVDQDLRSRITTINRETGEAVSLLLKLPRKNWVFHDAEGDKNTRYVDVAAMKIPQKWQDYLRVMGSSWFYDDDIKAPSEILVFGFPEDVGFELKSQRPISRVGVISMCSDELFISDREGKYWPPKACIIDTKMLGGNSGSPVLNKPISGTYKLLGLVSGGNLRMDYGIMEPISRIKEVLEKTKKQPLPKDNLWFLYPKPAPASTVQSSK